MMKRNKDVEIKYGPNNGYIGNVTKIPVGWTIRCFADIADYKAGRTPARANTDYWTEDDDGVPWVTIADMSDFGIVSDTKERISKIAFDRVFRGQIVPVGTLIMSFKLTIGRVATLGIDALHNEAIIAIFPKKDIDQRYLGYFLSQVDYNLLQDRQVKGNTLNREKIDRIEVWVPPLAEQTAIANVLEVVQKAKEIEAKCKQTAQKLKLSVMRVLFKQGLRNEPQKETSIGSIPESWHLESIGNLFQIVQGLSLKGNLSDDDQGAPFLRTSNVYWGRIELNSISRMHASAEIIGDRVLKRDDLLVCEGGEIGRAAVWNDEIKDCTFQNHLHRLRPKLATQIIPKFAMWWLEEGFCHRDIYQGAGNQTTIPNLSRARLAGLVMPVPPLDEQQEIVEILEAIDRKIDLHQRKYSTLNLLFQSLLHQSLIGNIRVFDLNLSIIKDDMVSAVSGFEKLL